MSAIVSIKHFIEAHFVKVTNWCALDVSVNIGCIPACYRYPATFCVHNSRNYLANAEEISFCVSNISPARPYLNFLNASRVLDSNKAFFYVGFRLK